MRGIRGMVLCLGLAGCTGTEGPEATPPALEAPPADSGVVAAPGDTLSLTTLSGDPDLVRLLAPHPDEVIPSPLVVRGLARGPWFFEGSFPLTLTNWDGLIIAEGVATAQGEWMTEEYVPFEGTLAFETPEDIGDFSRRGALILRKDNPSALPEMDDALELTIFFREAP